MKKGAFDDSSDEEVKPPVKAPPKPQPVKKAVAMLDSDSDEVIAKPVAKAAP